MSAAPDDGPPSDPELIAYLDGELDADASRAMEAEIATNPKIRSRSEQYQKSYDLLDYLPKPQASSTFTTRTITKLQPVLNSVPLPSGAIPTVHPPIRSGYWIGAALVALAAGLGYFGHLAVDPILNRPEPIEKFDQADLPLVHELPLYIGVDDFEFVRSLRDTDFAADESATANSPPQTALVSEEHEKISLAEQQKLIDLFQGYSPARRQQLRALHRQLLEQPAKERRSYQRTLEAYAGWLDRLPDVSRNEILSSGNPADRMDAVLRARERQWRESLPASQQKVLKSVVSVEERKQYLNELRQRDEAFKREWLLTHRQWQPNKSDETKAYPFDNPALAKSVEDFIRKAFGVDLSQPVDRKGELSAPCRLTREEWIDLKIRHDAALKEGYWFSYGACLLQLAEQHPMLPEPGNAKPLTHYDQPPLSLLVVRKLVRNEGVPLPQRFRTTLGRWPDFALEIHKLDAASKDREKLPPLGPCRPGEFTEEVEVFLKNQFFGKLTKVERDRLDSQLGKWPEYPRLMIELAKAKNLSVPGAMLPGEPKLWNDYYRLTPTKK